MTKQDTAQAEDRVQESGSKDTDERAQDEKQESANKGDGEGQDAPYEKPEPDDEAKEKAHKNMKSYVDRPTLIVPGSGGAISGTAVNDWLDDEGNPRFADDEDSPANKAKNDSKDESGDEETKDKAPKDKDSQDDDSQNWRNVTGADSTTASDGEKTRGEAAEEREREKEDKPMEERIEEDKEFNKRILDEAGLDAPHRFDEESGRDSAPSDKESERAASSS